ncbi:branched-chain amino acid ABC transporter permease [Halobellus sp. Atlit-38R]|uniref:branched-chain amino acid ABC transporter permease n=1 Tax=Halobellus sp. Atlit-38R TaxID=2282131 RepID=UPI000EF2846F|nr:branched-chain amino acid ABC transporter permease [Halobellus sp. Atlit-38R]RLM89262.1 branched-chain amino acid ABC transporter permease [Halobellus sp. Atlit-38R]
MNAIPIPGTQRSITPAGGVVWGVLVLLTVMSAIVRPGLFIDQVIGGLVYGLVLVLIALGLSIVLGLLGIVNFAHGALFMLGAYFTFQLMEVWGVSFWVTLIVAPIGVGLVGVAIERGVLRHLYDKNPLNGLLATFGIALMLGEATRAIWGGTPRSVVAPQVLSMGFDLGVTTVSRIRLFTVAVAVIVIAAVYLLIERTDFGLSVRAGVLDREMAEFLGVNMNVRFISMFVLGAAIAGLGGVLRGAAVGMDVGMANQFIILAFVVVVVGGIGSLFGSVVAGLLIGGASYLTPLYLSTLAEVTTLEFINIPGIGGLVPYLVMIVVLLARPRGLFGQEGFLE